MITRIHYFGCRQGAAGHFMSPSLPYAAERYLNRFVNRFDGALCPPRSAGLYRIAVSRFYGLGITSLAWWDQSQDKREGSNSIVFYPGADASKEDALAEFVKVFPWAFKRIPEPLRWYVEQRP